MPRIRITQDPRLVGWAEVPPQFEASARSRMHQPVHLSLASKPMSLNSIMLIMGEAWAAWMPLRAMMVETSSIGLLVAISAFGLGTTVRALLDVGWQQLAVFGISRAALLPGIAMALAAS